MSRALKIAIVTAAAIILLAAGTLVGLLGGDRVYPGVRIAGADLGNMTVDQARRRISLQAVDVTARQVVLKYAYESRKAVLAELGGQVDVSASAHAAFEYGRRGNLFHRLAQVLHARRRPVDLPVAYRFDRDTATRFLADTAKAIDREPENARPIIAGDTISIRPEKPGIRLNTDKSLARIARSVNSGEREVQLVVETAEPKVAASDLHGIDGLVGSYSTPYNSWERDRSYNLRLACRAVDGTLLMPGEVFSYNKIVGPRDRKYGFRDAKMFVEGRIESGTGGGVCQVSTTVYNAALLAGLQIVTRSHHSRPVVYAPVGRDATVAPTIDLKFRNNTDSPLYISAACGERTVSVNMYGRKEDGRQIEIVAVGHSTIGPKTVRRMDGSVESGSVVRSGGRSGHRVTIYRVVKEDGQEVSRELISRDYYAPETRVIAVPGAAEM